MAQITSMVENHLIFDNTLTSYNIYNIYRKLYLHRLLLIKTIQSKNRQLGAYEINIKLLCHVLMRNVTYLIKQSRL